MFERDLLNCKFYHHLKEEEKIILQDGDSVNKVDKIMELVTTALEDFKETKFTKSDRSNKSPEWTKAFNKMVQWMQHQKKCGFDEENRMWEKIKEFAKKETNGNNRFSTWDTKTLEQFLYEVEDKPKTESEEEVKWE